MKSESQLVASLWDLVRDQIASGRRLETAISFLKLFEDYGFDSSEMHDIVDEDVYLKRAFDDLFGDDEDEEENEDY
jgi:hypothetical protein